MIIKSCENGLGGVKNGTEKRHTSFLSTAPNKNPFPTNGFLFARENNFIIRLNCNKICRISQFVDKNLCDNTIKKYPRGARIFFCFWLRVLLIFGGRFFVGEVDDII